MLSQHTPDGQSGKVRSGGRHYFYRGGALSVNPTSRKVKGGHHDLAGMSRIDLSEKSVSCFSLFDRSGVNVAAPRRGARQVRLLIKYVLDRLTGVPINYGGYDG